MWSASVFSVVGDFTLVGIGGLIQHLVEPAGFRRS